MIKELDYVQGKILTFISSHRVIGNTDHLIDHLSIFCVLKKKTDSYQESLTIPSHYEPIVCLW